MKPSDSSMVATKVGRNSLLALAAFVMAGGAVVVVTLFADEAKNAPAQQAPKQTVVTLPGSKIPASIGDRIKYVQGLSDVQKQELEEKKKKFDLQTPERKKQLRKLAKQLAEHKESAKLSSTLTMYHDFLISLDENEMIRLKQATDDRKIEVIRSIETARNQWMVHQPKPSDAAAIYQWMLDHANLHRDKLIKQLSESRIETAEGKQRSEGQPQGPGHFQQMLLKAIQSDVPERAEVATIMAYQRALWLARNRREEGGRLAPSEKDIDQLLSRLSPVLSNFYRANDEPAKKAELLGGWQWYAIFTLGRGLPSNDETYAEIAKLSEAEQKALSPMPLDQKKWWLVRKTFDERMDFKGPGPNPGPPGAPRAPGGWNSGFGGPRFEYWGPSKKREEGHPPGGKGPPPHDGQSRTGGPPGPTPGENRPRRPKSEESKPDHRQSPMPKSEELKSDKKEETLEPDKAVRQFARKLRVRRTS